MSAPRLDLVPGLTQGAYVTDPNHALLSEDAWKAEGSNIGANGCNLTISFLSMNRATLSEKLLRSINTHIPAFAGEVLIIDNGSTQFELDYLRRVCGEMPYRTRIVELGANYGVAGGRNRTIPHVTTDWLMCLDNDIYFLFDPLPAFQRDMAVLGCHFMSLPLLDPDGQTLFALGGHLYVSLESDELHIGAGSAYLQQAKPATQTPAFLSTFLFGGACIFKKSTFLSVGGYDDAMFVGFEDIDFSIRLFQLGYKVGTSATCALVHDHPKPASDADRDYEKERFSRNMLRESALHLEAKHGFKIWSDAVDHWLSARHEDLGLGTLETVSSDSRSADAASDDGRPRIALVIDTDNWAFGNIASQLTRHLSDRYSFKIIPMDVIDNIDQVFMMAADCQIVHFFWREHLQMIGSPYFRSYIESIGLNYANFEREFVDSKLLGTSVYDHLFLTESELKEREALFRERIAGYTVSSKKLQEIYGGVSAYPQPTSLTEDGVDLSVFQPTGLERFSTASERPLVVGWVGNSKWSSELEDFKGLHTILVPALEELVASGFHVIPFFADRQERYIPHTEMPDYYAKLDVLVCVSKIEGTPNPVLEAMACGVPVISTDVGIVPQAFGPLQSQFILPERTVDALKTKLVTLCRQPELLASLSSENLLHIRAWDWPIMVEKFDLYFKRMLSKKAS